MASSPSVPAPIAARPGWVTNSTALFQDGVAVSGANLFGFWDTSNSTTAFRADGTHTTGIDISNATLSYGIALPNNVAIIQRDNAGTYRDVVRVDASNVLQIGWSGASVGLAGQAISYGPPDSCGTGYRCVRVPN